MLARILFLILATLKKLSRAWAVLLIIAATVFVYWPAVRNGFVKDGTALGFVWDDTALVLRDPLIRSWRLIPEGFRHFLFLDATASKFYRPIQRLSFVADYQLYGFDSPGGWHRTSVLIHAGAAVALFFLAEKLLALAMAGRLSETARRAWALGVSLLWAIHPLHTSAVTYVAGRADPLAALFGFTALALGLTSLEGPKRVWLWRLGAAACFGLAILSKESGGMFLVIWALVLAWRRADPRSLAVWAVLIAAVVGGYCSLRYTAHKVPPPVAPPTPVAVRPILAARAFLEYTGLIVAPVTLRMERDVSTAPRETFSTTMQNARLREFETLGGVLLLFGFGLWVRFAWRRAPGAAFCLGAFALAYIPISNAFPLNATIAEHWLYVPNAFLFLAVALTLLAGTGCGEKSEIRNPNRAERDSLPQAARRAAPAGAGKSETNSKSLNFEKDADAGSSGFALSNHWNLFRISIFGFRIFPVLTGIAAAWFLLLCARTYFRQEDWRDQRTFVERTIATGGDSARLLMNLANRESNAGQDAKAVTLYREALRRSPDQPIIWLGFANILARAGDVPGAREAMGHATTSPLLHADGLQLEASLAQADGNGNPRELLHEAVASAPANWPLRKRYVEALEKSGAVVEARNELAAFLKEYPFRAESWKVFGRLLEETGETALAHSAYAEAAARDVRDK